MPRPKILITGSEGFIGRNIRKALDPHFDISRFDLSLSVFHNITQKEEVFSFIETERPNIIIHLAANPDVSKSLEFPQEDLYLNTLGTLNVLEACRKFPVELFFLASSAVVYGEMKDRASTETDTLNPTTPYGIGKLAAEHYCNLYFRRYGIPTVIFRLFNIYGAGQSRSFAIPNLIARIHDAKDEMMMYGNRNDTRDFVYIEDICNAFKMCIEKKPKGMTFNLASGKETTVLEVAETIARLMGKNIRFFYKDTEKDTTRVSRVLGDGSLIHKEVGWAPQIPLVDGLSKILRSVQMADTVS